MSNQAKRPGAEQHGPEPTRNPQGHHDDDAILVPKGTSKLTFLFLLGLTIFILVIFTVGDEIMQSIGRRSASADDVTWDGPVVGKKVISASEFLDEKRREDQFRSLMGSQNARFEDEELATELLIDELAERSGIEISQAALARAIFDGIQGLCPPFQNFELYTSILEGSRVAPPVFESVLRRKLRIDRYMALLRGATVASDSALIEAEWKKGHPQFAYDAIELEHAKFDAEARAAQPDAAGMRAWYDAIPEKRGLFSTDFTPATNAAELIAYRFGAANDAAGLLAKFPPPAGEDAEQKAKDYYNQYSSVRFVRETPLPDDPTVSLGKDRLINSYDEVSSLCHQEAAVANAMRAWVADVKARKKAGEKIDLAAEAAALGLSYRASDGAKNETDWTNLADFGGPFIARSISGTLLDDFGADISVDRRAIGFARVIEKNASAPPAYEAVAEKAAAEWLKQKLQELAVAKLTLIRDSFKKPDDTGGDKTIKADEAAFKAAAEAQGLSVMRRDWMSFAEQNNDREGGVPLHEFIRFNGYLRNLGPDEVSLIQQDRTRTHSYLVRALGSREPPAAKLAPGDVEAIQSQLDKQRFESFIKDNFSPKALAARYNLRVRGSKEVPEPGP